MPLPTMTNFDFFISAPSTAKKNASASRKKPWVHSLMRTPLSSAGPRLAPLQEMAQFELTSCGLDNNVSNGCANLARCKCLTNTQSRPVLHQSGHKTCMGWA
jgi:hypothetical protein